MRTYSCDGNKFRACNPGDMEARARQLQAKHCADWCGGGCTQAQFEYATKKARELAEELGEGWKPDIWENLGWHWRVLNEGMKVHPGDEEGNYLAFLGEPDTPGGRWVGCGDSPQAALEAAIKSAEEERDTINACLDAVRRVG